MCVVEWQQRSRSRVWSLILLLGLVPFFDQPCPVGPKGSSQGCSFVFAGLLPMEIVWLVLELCSHDSTRIFNVKGHATDLMVLERHVGLR